LDIKFKRKRLADICNSEQALVAEFGRDNAKKIMMRLNELDSVDNLSQISHLPPPRRHALHENRERQFSVDIKQPYRLIFEPANNPSPLDADGNVDLTRITEITILEVVDYHGE
jgi:proteic killer suppression protein